MKLQESLFIYKKNKCALCGDDIKNEIGECEDCSSKTIEELSNELFGG